MKYLLAVSAVIELGAGLALLCSPSAMALLLIGAPLETPAPLIVARIGGAGLFSLGIACWVSRPDDPARPPRGLIAAMLFYDLAAAAILAFAALADGLHGLALWPAVLLHALMALWCAASLQQTR